jgi:hypothetical protein
MQIIADSVNFHYDRLTTFVGEVPFSIWNEVLTHRAFSRNADSRRAIPFLQSKESVMSRPYVPTFTDRRAGMQGEEITDPAELQLLQRHWYEARDLAVACAHNFEETHKTWANTIIAPYKYLKVIITSSAAGWENFFRQRCDKAAHPDLQKLALSMEASYRSNVPKSLVDSDWHMPFGKPLDTLNENLMYNAGRAARISYGKDYEDVDPYYYADLGQKILSAEPAHLSVAEHCAQCRRDWHTLNSPKSSNLAPGWLQYRCLLGAPIKAPQYDNLYAGQ